jgi:L-ascorbate metabolism protein UlaG (beta-lactamase superfamily)
VKIFLYLRLLFSTSQLLRHKSDHFDGRVFSNPEINVNKSFFDVLKWQFSGQKKKWPSWRELESQAPAKIPKADEVSTTYINHATHLIQINDIYLLTDPVFSKRLGPVSWAGPRRVHRPAIDIESLPKVDVVLISHNHYDHMDSESIRHLSEKFDPLFVVPIGNQRLIATMGARRVIELDWWQEANVSKREISNQQTLENRVIENDIPESRISENQIAMNNIRVTLVPVQHWSARGLFDRNQALWGGFVFETLNLKLFFAGDTGYAKVFRDIFKKFGKMDLSILPIGAYEPRWFMREQHMNPEEAVQAHLDLESRFTIGTHFGTFQLTDEAIDTPVADLKAALEKMSVSPGVFVAPKPGESHLICKAK